MAPAERDVVVDLQRAAEGEVAYAPKDVIQRDAQDAVLGKLVVMRPPVNNKKPGRIDAGLLTNRVHESIVVNARRGEGKTTFLLQLLARLRDDPAVASARLYPLGILDPTLIETKQNVVVMVLRLIQRAVYAARDESRGRDDGGFTAFQKSLRQLAGGLPVLDGIGKPVFHGDEWADKDYVLETGLEDAGAASAFESHFHELVEVALGYLDRSAFVLAVDDVDTWFERGWPVLEAVRKYFTTPGLRIVMSGDLELYSLLVRRQQWAQMGRRMVEVEAKTGGRSRLAMLSRMIDSLQDQYLIKVAKPENRIDLKSLDQIAEGGNLRFAFGSERTPEWDTSSEFENQILSAEQAIKQYASHVLALRAEADVRQVRQTLLQIPTRSALQTLGGAVDLLRPGSDRVATEVGRDRALAALRHVAQTSLAKHGIALDELRRAGGDALASKLAGWLTRTHRWQTMGRLEPKFSDDDQNVVAIAVASVVVDRFRQQPGAMIDFWLKIATVRDMIDNGRVVDADGRPAGIEGLVRHLRLDMRDTALNTVGRLGAYELTLGSQAVNTIRLSGATVPIDRVREVQPGFRALYGLGWPLRSLRKNAAAPDPASGEQGGDSPPSAMDVEAFLDAFVEKASEDEKLKLAVPPPLFGFHLEFGRDQGAVPAKRKKATIGHFANSLQSLSEKVDPAARIALSAASFNIVSGQRSDSASVSVLSLLAVVGMLLDLAPEEVGKPISLEAVRAVLDNVLSPRSHPTARAVEAGLGSPPAHEQRGARVRAKPRIRAVAAGADVQGEMEEEGSADAPGGSGDGGNGASDAPQLTSALTAWLNYHRPRLRGHALAPVAFTRMSTRLSAAFAKMAAALEPVKTRYLGVLLHRAILVTLQTIGLEAMRSGGITTQRSANKNVVKNGEPLESLLESIYGPVDKNNPAVVETDREPEVLFFDAVFSCPIWTYFLARSDDWETGERRRKQINEMIFLRHHQRLHAYDAPVDFASVTYDDQELGRKAIFPGLFFPLNTVYLLGGPSPKPNLRLHDRLSRQPSSG